MKFARYLAFLCIATFALLAAAEIVTRVLLCHFADGDLFMVAANVNQFAKYGVSRSRLVPHAYLGWVPRPNFRDGLLSHNSRGFRGAEFAMPKPANEFRIVCMGGSTTYDDEIQDDAKTYPARLQFYLEQKGVPAKVVNAGVPAWSSYEDLVSFAFRVSSIEPDLIITNDGWHDLMARLAPPEAYASDNSAVRGGAIPTYPWYEQLTLPRLINVLFRWSGQESMQRSQGWALMARPTATVARLVDGPVLTREELARLFSQNPPVHFKRNLVHLVGMARSQGTQALLLTYPFLRIPMAFPYLRESSQHRKDILELSVHAMDEMNMTTMSVGQEMQTPAFDLASAYPQHDDTHQYFVDAVHNTEAGSDLKARLIADYLVENGLVPKANPAGDTAPAPQTP